ncbi:hypothetical protein HN873_029251 [Arachis hypogaea]
MRVGEILLSRPPPHTSHLTLMEQRTLAPPVSRSPAATATPGATGGPAVTAAPAAPLRCNRETLLRWEAPSPRCLDKAAIVSDAESKIDYFPDPWRLHCDTS